MEIILCETWYCYVIEQKKIDLYIYINIEKRKKLITILRKNAFTNRI